MSMLEDLARKVTAETGGGDSHARMAMAALEMLNARGGAGGLHDLAQTFQSKGLGDMMASWIGTGPNPPISPDQVHQALGAEQVQALAQKAGVSPDLAKSLLAAVLPVLVDKLTPTGTLPPQGSSLLGDGIGLLRKFL